MSENTPASQRFWTLKRRIEQDAHHPGVTVSLRRGNAVYDIAKMIADGVISLEALEGFSNELTETVRFLSPTDL